MTRFLLVLCCCTYLLSPRAPRAEPARQAPYLVWSAGGGYHENVASERVYWDAERDALRSVLQVGSPSRPT